MKKEFKYRPRYGFLLFGLVGLLNSFYLFSIVGFDEIGFALLAGLIAICSLLLAVVFLIMFARHLGSFNLKISDNQIEIPQPWRKKTILNLQQLN